ncbi:MAG: hypothetical protein H6720_15110 [Sandaracinus sp.]|nr:hypothetical protein [Sandaracinus sp.]
MTPFVGRTSERAELARRLEPGALITVLGPPGVGKSRLVEQGLRVALRGVNDDVGFWDALARAVDVAPCTDSMAAVVATLATLDDEALILDDADEVPPDAIASLGTLVEIPRVVTSRRRLGLSDEQVIELAPLDEAEGVALLDAWLANLRGRPANEAERPWLASIVRRLDGLPLAIELAAARARVMSVAALARRLDEGLDALSAPRDRSRGLDAALQTTWQSLGDAERSVLAQLTAFAGSFDIDAAEAVVRVDATTVLDALQELRDRSLLVQGEDGRLRVLHVLRRFARERSDDTVLREAERRHGEHFARRLERRHDDERLAELDDLLLAIDRLRTRHAPRSDEAEAALRGLLALCPLLLVRGPLGALAGRLEPVLTTSARSGADLGLLARAGAMAARVHARVGDLASATKALAHARLVAAKAATDTQVGHEVAIAGVEVALATGDDPSPWVGSLADEGEGAWAAARAFDAMGAHDQALDAARRARSGDRVIALAAGVWLAGRGEPIPIAPLRDEAKALDDRASWARLLALDLAGLAEAKAIAERLGDVVLVRELAQRARPVSRRLLRVATDGSSFTLDGLHVDLRTRRALRLLLVALAKADGPLAWDALLAAGWPGERVSAEAAMQRVRVAISTLRKLGLADALETVEGGYRISGEVVVEEG